MSNPRISEHLQNHPASDPRRPAPMAATFSNDVYCAPCSRVGFVARYCPCTEAGARRLYVPGGWQHAVTGLAEGAIRGGLRVLCYMQIKTTGKVEGWRELAEQIFRDAIEKLEAEHDLQIGPDGELVETLDGAAIVSAALASAAARAASEREKGTP